MADGIVNLTAETFDETVLGSEHPVVVDFWAEWCHPCKKIAPVLEEIAHEYGDSVHVAKLDVDAHPDIARQYGVMSIPTLLVFKNGEVDKRLVGAKSKGALLEELGEFLVTSR